MHLKELAITAVVNSIMTIASTKLLARTSMSTAVEKGLTARYYYLYDLLG